MRRLSKPVNVRFPPALMRRVKAKAAKDGRSVSDWIRRAVERAAKGA